MKERVETTLAEFEVLQERFRRNTERNGIWKRAITALINGAPAVRVPHEYKGKSIPALYHAAEKLGVRVSASLRDGYVYIQLREERAA